MKIVFDLECDGLNPSTIWVIVAKDIDTNIVKKFSDYCDECEPLDNFKLFFDQATHIIAHNGIKFDLPVLKKLTGWQPKVTQQVVDTLIMSKLNNYVRPGTKAKHGLDPWGELVGVVKPPIKEWMEWNPEFVHRCTEDVEINHKVYNIVMKEAKDNIDKRPLYRTAIRNEHELSKITREQTELGFRLNTELLDNTLDEVKGKMKEIEDRIEPQLGTIDVFIDKIPKVPKYKKNGEYTAACARMLSEHFGTYIDPVDALSDSPPIQPNEEYQRKHTVEARLGNQDHLKQFLISIGWDPDEWNWKLLPNGQYTKVSPKLTSTSLQRLGPIGEDVDLYFTLRARKGILEGYKANLKGDRIHHDSIDIGTNTFRQGHKIIANIPGAHAAYGKECRSLFIPDDGKVFFGIDSASNHVRILAHYLKNEEFTDIVMNRDMHAFNAQNIGCDRQLAKQVFFCVLYGGGIAKVAKILNISDREGKIKRQALIDGIPGLNKFLVKIENFHKGTQQGRFGYLPAIDGRKVWSDSSFKGLNYIIQATEAAVMKHTYVRTIENLRKANMDIEPKLMYHDEILLQIDPKDGDKVKSIVEQTFVDAPKELGIFTMSHGGGMIGNNYYEVH